MFFIKVILKKRFNTRFNFNFRKIIENLFSKDENFKTLFVGHESPLSIYLGTPPNQPLIYFGIKISHQSAKQHIQAVNF